MRRRMLAAAPTVPQNSAVRVGSSWRSTRCSRASKIFQPDGFPMILGRELGRGRVPLFFDIFVSSVFLSIIFVSSQLVIDPKPSSLAPPGQSLRPSLQGHLDGSTRTVSCAGCGDIAQLVDSMRQVDANSPETGAGLCGQLIGPNRRNSARLFAELWLIGGELVG